MGWSFSDRIWDSAKESGHRELNIQTLVTQLQNYVFSLVVPSKII